MRKPPSRSTLQASVALALTELAATKGLQPHEISKELGVSLERALDPQHRIPLDKMMGVLDRLVGEPSDRRLLVEHVDAIPLTAMGLVGFGMRSCASFRDALRHFHAYQRLFADHHSVSISEDDEGMTVVLQPFPIAPPLRELSLEARVLLLTSFGRRMTGVRWSPTFVSLPSALSTDSSLWRYLGCEARRAPGNAKVRLGRDVLELPVRDAQRDMLPFFEEQTRRALAARPAKRDETVAQRAGRALRDMPAGQPTSANAVARLLGMSRRTLFRRLEAEGTTLREVHDAVRFETAQQLLLESDRTIDEIAIAVGYGDARSFRRAFLRWTATTPSAHRALERSEDLS